MRHLDALTSFGEHSGMTTQTPPKTDGAGELTFEQTLKKLEEVVAKLERGDLPLEQSLEAYEQGIALVRSAQGRLDGMDKRLEQLLHDGKLGPMKAPEG